MDNMVELQWVVAVIRRWFWLIVLCALLSAGIATALTSRIPPVYDSTATLLVQPSLGMGTGASENALFASERLALTYSQMLSGRPVMEAVIARLGLKETPQTLARRIRVSPVPNTQLIRVTATSPGPKTAALLADTVAEVFVEHVQTLQMQRYMDFLASVQQQMAELSAAMDETQLKMDRLSIPRTDQEEAELAQLETILAGHRSTYEMLLQTYAQMRLTEAQSAETVVISERAQVPEDPVQHRTLYTAVASMVGATVAAGAAFVLEHLDDTVRTREDVRHVVGLDTLGTIIRFAQSDEKLMMLAQPGSPVAEAFRVLASNVWFSMLDASLRTILVTSPGTEEGKSTIVANLAVAMAQLGLKVVVLDADLRRSEMGPLFGLDSRQQGLVAALLGNGRVNRLLQPTEVEGLTVLQAGYSVPGWTRLLGSDRVQAVLDGLADHADVILIDSPPVLPVADTALLARGVDGLLLVLEAGRTRREDVQHTMESLQQANASLIGVVLNAVPARWYKRHYSRYEYTEDREHLRWRPSPREQRADRRGYGLRDGSLRKALDRIAKLAGELPMGHGSSLLMRLRSNGNILGRMQEDARIAARTDLPAITRARSLARLREQLVDTTESEVGSSRELNDLVGQRVAAVAGRTVSGRLVRRYLSLLSLPREVQDCAEANGLRESQLRPLRRLDSPEEQFTLVKRIAREGLTGAEVDRLVRGELRYKKAVLKQHASS